MNPKHNYEAESRLMAFGRSCALVYKGAYQEVMGGELNDVTAHDVGIEAVRAYAIVVEDMLFTRNLLPEKFTITPITNDREEGRVA